MNVDVDLSLLEWGFKGVVGLALGMGAWMWTRLVSRVGELAKTVTDNKEESMKSFSDHQQALADHKLAVSENYAKKTDLQPIYSKLDEIQKDTKVIIGVISVLQGKQNALQADPNK